MIVNRKELEKQCIGGHFGHQEKCGTEMFDGCSVSEECTEEDMKRRPEAYIPVSELEKRGK
jgi:hypothetical protein